MQLSDAGLQLIKTSEGFRSSTYIDATGNATIGYGHKLLPGESFPNGITEAQGEQLLAADVNRAEHAVAGFVKVELTQGQFDALVDFCYNLGPGKLQTSTLLRDLNAGNYDGAHQQLLLWDHAGTAVLPGLKIRREAEFALWSGSSSPVPPPDAPLAA